MHIFISQKNTEDELSSSPRQIVQVHSYTFKIIYPIFGYLKISRCVRFNQFVLPASSVTISQVFLLIRSNRP